MSDTRDLYKLFRELENQHQENDTVRLHDSFDLELNEHFVIESGVVGLTEDGVIIQLDEAALEFLDFNGMLTESVELNEISDELKTRYFVKTWPKRGETVPDKRQPFRQQAAAAADRYWDKQGKENDAADVQKVLARTPKVHDLRHMSHGEVYDLTQTSDEIRDGDVLHVKGGSAILFKAWPTMVKGDSKSLHTWDAGNSWDDEEVSHYKRAVDIARSLPVNSDTSRGARDVDESVIAEGSSRGVADAIRFRILNQHRDIIAKYGPVRIMAAIGDKADGLDNLEEIGSSDVSIWTNQVIADLENGYYDDMDPESPVKRDVPESAEDSDIFAKIVKSDDPFQVIYDGISGHFGEEARIKLQAVYDDVALDYGDHPDDDFEEIIDRMIPRIHELHDIGFDYLASKKDELDEIKKLAFGRDALEENPMLMALGRMSAAGAARDLADNVDEGWGKNLLGAGAVVGALAAIAGVDKMEADRLMKTEPQLVTLTQMRQEAEQEGDDGAVDALDHRIRVTLNSIRDKGRPVMGPDGEPVDPRKPLDEAEYQGRKVTLNKPMQGDVAKSKVYVKKPDGKVVKVNFGDKNMTIKKSNPARRKSFRARHNCENPGPKWKARYWSCRAW